MNIATVFYKIGQTYFFELVQSGKLYLFLDGGSTSKVNTQQE
jgi:hypothetical protein